MVGVGYLVDVGSGRWIDGSKCVGEASSKEMCWYLKEAN